MFKRNRPTPAFVLAFVALCVALTSSAVAGVPAQIARAISGSSIKSHSISGSKLKSNTLTGKQVAESKLSIVPKSKRTLYAHNAGTALSAASVGGLVPHRLDFVAAKGTNPSSILNVQGLNVQASCSPAGVPVLTATSSVNDSDVRVGVVQTNQTKTGANATRAGADSNFDSGQTINATAGATRGNGTLAFVRPDNHTVFIEYSFHGTPSLGATENCVFSGVAFEG